MTLGFWLICFLRCYFTTNSRAVCDTYRNSPMDWSERITLRWFCTLQAISSYVLRDRNFGVTFVARGGIVYDPIILSLLRELALVKVWTLGLVSTHCNTVYAHFYRLLPCCFYIFRLQKPLSTIHIPLVSPSLRQTSAPIQFTIVLGVLGTQETLCYLVAGLLERDHLNPTPPTDW